MDKPAKAVGLPLSATASLDKIGEYTVVKDPEHTALGPCDLQSPYFEEE